MGYTLRDRGTYHLTSIVSLLYTGLSGRNLRVWRCLFLEACVLYQTMRTGFMHGSKR